MDEFIGLGLGWVVKACFIEFKRPLVLGDTIVVRTWIDAIGNSDVKVRFEILRKSSGKLASDGHFEYTMVNLATGRSENIPQSIIDKYSI